MQHSLFFGIVSFSFNYFYLTFSARGPKTLIAFCYR